MLCWVKQRKKKSRFRTWTEQLRSSLRTQGGGSSSRRRGPGDADDRPPKGTTWPHTIYFLPSAVLSGATSLAQHLQRQGTCETSTPFSENSRREKVHLLVQLSS